MMTLSLQRDFAFSKLAEKFDLSEELNEAGRIVKVDIQEHIHNQKRIDNEAAFTPLKPATIASKRGVVAKKTSRRLAGLRRETREGRITHEGFATKADFIRSTSDPTKALIRTGNLLLNQKIEKATKQTQTCVISIGSTREKIAEYQQEGTETIPPRPFFGISEVSKKKIINNFTIKVARLIASVKV